MVHSELEQLDVVMRRQRLALLVGKLLPRAAFELTFPQRAFYVAVGDPLDGFAVELRIRPVRTELARPTQFEGQVAGPDDGDALIAGPGLEKAAQGAAQLDEPPRLRKWRSKDICVDGHDGQVRLWAGRNDGARDTVVDAQFVTEGEVKTGIQPGTKKVRREFFVSLQHHAGQPELALLIVVVR